MLAFEIMCYFVTLSGIAFVLILCIKLIKEYGEPIGEVKISIGKGITIEGTSIVAVFLIGVILVLLPLFLVFNSKKLSELKNSERDLKNYQKWLIQQARSPMKISPDDIEQFYRSVAATIRRGDKTTLERYFSDHYNKNGKNKSDVLSSWNDFLGKSILFNIEKVQPLPNGKIQVEVMAEMHYDNANVQYWRDHDVLINEDGQWKFLE